MTNNSRDTKEYWTERSEKMDAEIAADLAAAQSYRQQVDAMMVKLSAVSDSNRESEKAEKTIIWAQIEQLEAAAAAEEQARESELAAKQQAEIDNEWTLEVTQQRRADWNAWARKTDPRPVDVAKRQRQQGWTMDMLKKAIAHHE